MWLEARGCWCPNTRRCAYCFYLNRCLLFLSERQVVQNWKHFFPSENQFDDDITNHVWPFSDLIMFNSLRPSDVIWQYNSESVLAQIRFCCLVAPSHQLNQYWLLIIEVMAFIWEQFHIKNTQAAILYNEFENYTPKILPHLPWATELNYSIFKLNIVLYIYIYIYLWSKNLLRPILFVLID